jgi:hypothetical protein
VCVRGNALHVFVQLVEILTEKMSVEHLRNPVVMEALKHTLIALDAWSDALHQRLFVQTPKATLALWNVGYRVMMACSQVPLWTPSAQLLVADAVRLLHGVLHNAMMRAPKVGLQVATYSELGVRLLRVLDVETPKSFPGIFCRVLVEAWAWGLCHKDSPVSDPLGDLVEYAGIVLVLQEEHYDDGGRWSREVEEVEDALLELYYPSFVRDEASDASRARRPLPKKLAALLVKLIGPRRGSLAGTQWVLGMVVGVLKVRVSMSCLFYLFTFLAVTACVCGAEDGANEDEAVVEAALEAAEEAVTDKEDEVVCSACPQLFLYRGLCVQEVLCVHWCHCCPCDHRRLW